MFKQTDGYEEVMIRKVIHWINTSSLTDGPTKLKFKIPATQMVISMKSGDVATVEPAYNCINDKQRTECIISEGEVVFTLENQKYRLRSPKLYDWLMVGWKNENIGVSNGELLEETLYFRYFPYLENTYADFIMCPRIDIIERIYGDTRRHVVHASALNYSSHHDGVFYDRIHITLTDSPDNGVKITHVAIQRSISEEESRVQCRR
ncbi:hypothetical protein JCM10914A_49250 [Paenibacillus sp. JCM 10914]|uniref:hypothetical protein n=1 Tax=Paenibacillus sp. JCM 10914 TaxID=1236974 RepID=UPI0011DC9750|nr:hypothetical protein [Paenibacillus sp. JCM 10914]